MGGDTQHTLQRSPEKVTAGEVHPTQGDTNPKGIARKTSAGHTPANLEVQDTDR